MKLSIAQFLQLQEYGYSLDEIRQYEGESVETQQPAAQIDTDTVSGEQPEPAQTTPTDTATNTDTATDTATNTGTTENETQAMLRELMGLIRTGNINHNGTTPVQQDPAAVMASILNPATGEAKK